MNDELLAILVRRGVVTVDPADRDECCGLPRDEDGFCTYREGHPIYVDRQLVLSETCTSVPPEST